VASPVYPTEGRLDPGPREQLSYAESDRRRRKQVAVKVLGE
jgi:hypothetical protein